MEDQKDNEISTYVGEEARLSLYWITPAHDSLRAVDLAEAVWQSIACVTRSSLPHALVTGSILRRLNLLRTFGATPDEADSSAYQL